MNWLWFKSKITKTTLDKYRIKVITLKDGTKKYYPQYKEDNLSSEWFNILMTEKDNLILVDLSEYSLINDNHHLEDEAEASGIINSHKEYLKESRAKEFLLEEIIKID